MTIARSWWAGRYAGWNKDNPVLSPVTALTPAPAETLRLNGKACQFERDSNRTPFSNSKTQVLQDLIGIVAAIGLAFAVLSLVTGDTVGFDPRTKGQAAPNLLGHFSTAFKLSSAAGPPWQSVLDFVLVILVAYRFYFVNSRYLANRYGVRNLDIRDWRVYALLDGPFIIVEGLLFAGAGLMVNHAFAVIVCLNLGLFADVVWNLTSLAWLRLRPAYSRSSGAVQFKQLIEQTTSSPYFPERTRSPRWIHTCSLVNNGVMSLCVLGIALYFVVSPGAHALNHFYTWEYLVLFGLMLMNHEVSVLWYTASYFQHPDT